MKEEFIEFIHQLQDEICARLEEADGLGKFREDLWERPGGGGGKSRVMSGGKVFEKAGVSTSIVHGDMPAALQRNLQSSGKQFFACGISLVLHPLNPFVPTVHANYRYFEMYDGEELIDSWFGGGSDLTPYYLFESDAKHFHQTQKETAAQFGRELYPRFKKQCDEYFYNHHRGESRGIGGTFFDYLKANEDYSSRDWMAFTMAMGRNFLPSYMPILEKRKKLQWEDPHRYWQEIRRGRYVEFNLIHDRGTLFGIKTNGRTESILMSLPPRVRWDYDHQPEVGSEEEKLLHILKNPREWA